MLCNIVETNSKVSILRTFQYRNKIWNSDFYELILFLHGNKLHLFFFALQSLINHETGAPQEMAGLATHLHYHEPSNYVLISFLQRGLFHDLCQPRAGGNKSYHMIYHAYYPF